MSGAPGFQGSAFQKTPVAFQSGIQIVAAAYALGSPAFATPTLSVRYNFVIPAYALQSPVFATPGRVVIPLNVNAYTIAPLGWPLTPPSLHFNYHFSVTAYTLQSPVFATPTLLSGSNYHALHVNPYSLASPVFGLPHFNQVYALHANTYAVGPLYYGPISTGQNYHLRANNWAVHSPDFGSVGPMSINYHFSAAAYVLGPLYFLPPNAPITVDYTLRANAYWLQSPWPNHPRLVVGDISILAGFPPTYYTQAENAANMLTNLLNLILKSVPPQQTAAGDQLRRLVGTMRGNAEAVVRAQDSTLGTDLATIYLAADAAGATFIGMDAVRKFLMSQVASDSALTQAIYRSALVMTLAEQSKIISRTVFATQEEIQNMTIYMSNAFEAAAALGIDQIDVLVYQDLNAMGGALINHLGTTELQLPRYVSYRSGMPMPSLYLAQRIYQDPSRSEEIEAENDVINPAFCPVNLRILSNAAIGTNRFGT